MVFLLLEVGAVPTSEQGGSRLPGVLYLRLSPEELLSQVWLGLPIQILEAIA